ncbi:DUF1421 domain-containing protein [Psidium guajava]|nr:DUF1421 domain-containing protein [Psidium guajava]
MNRTTNSVASYGPQSVAPNKLTAFVVLPATRSLCSSIQSVAFLFLHCLGTTSLFEGYQKLSLLSGQTCCAPSLLCRYLDLLLVVPSLLLIPMQELNSSPNTIKAKSIPQLIRPTHMELLRGDMYESDRGFWMSKV